MRLGGCFEARVQFVEGLQIDLLVFEHRCALYEDLVLRFRVKSTKETPKRAHGDQLVQLGVRVRVQARVYLVHLSLLARCAFTALHIFGVEQRSEVEFGLFLLARGLHSRKELLQALFYA